MSAAIQFKNVTKVFQNTERVVDQLNLEIRAGEFVSFLGPSGCGKSTLLRLIAQLDRPTAGTIAIQNSLSSGSNSISRGFVFQDAALLPWKSVLDNTALPLELIGIERRFARKRAGSVLETVGLADAAQKYPNQLSGGMKMRVSVARALVNRPDLLLLDEPFAALDENTRYRLQEELRALWQELRMTVVFVTHSVSEAVFLSNRAILLSPRPSRIVLDRAIDLPESRSARLRTSAEFAQALVPINESFRAEKDINA